jgi:hypothetical protein
MKNLRFTTKLLMGAAVAFVMAFSFTACSDDDDDDPVAPVIPPATGAPQKMVNLDISSNTTWSNDTIYVLTSRVKVRTNVTLTIEPGTIVKGDVGQGTNAKVLMVMRNAKIIADGTASEPIIFTSINDQIQPGQVVSPNLPNDAVGLWGGLAILGNAVIASGDTDPNGGGFDYDQIEGVPASDPDGQYGGTDNGDTSGILRYVSVRHGGTQISGGNELNGISLGGVGSGTVLEYIEVVANADDGLEFYGGSVNASNVVVWNNGDDALDTDQNYIGTISNVFIVGPAGSVVELDGPEGGATSASNHTIQNVTAVATRGNTNAEDLLNFDDNTNINFNNVYYASTLSSQQKLNVNNVFNPIATFSNITLNVPVDSVSSYVNPNTASLVSAVSQGTVGQANAADFSGWSWAGIEGNLSAL